MTNTPSTVSSSGLGVYRGSAQSRPENPLKGSDWRHGIPAWQVMPWH